MITDDFIVLISSQIDQQELHDTVAYNKINSNRLKYIHFSDAARISLRRGEGKVFSTAQPRCSGKTLRIWSQ